MAGRADYYKTANNFFFCSNNVTKIAPRRPSESLPRSLSPSWECASFTLIYRDPQSTGHSHIFTELVLFSHPGRRNRPHCFSGNSPQVMAPPPPSAGNHHDACSPPFPTSSQHTMWTFLKHWSFVNPPPHAAPSLCSQEMLPEVLAWVQCESDCRYFF